MTTFLIIAATAGWLIALLEWIRASGAEWTARYWHARFDAAENRAVAAERRATLRVVGR